LGRSKKGRFGEWGGDWTRTKCGILINAFLLFEGASFEGHRKWHWEGDDIYLLCEKNQG